MMKALLISPRYPDTLWSLRHAVQFSQAKAMFPPLGLLTVATMLPADWTKKVVDLNVEPLTDSHLGWADIVFISAMTIQCDSADEVIRRCKERGLKIVAAGGVRDDNDLADLEKVGCEAAVMGVGFLARLGIIL